MTTKDEMINICFESFEEETELMFIETKAVKNEDEFGVEYIFTHEESEYNLYFSKSQQKSFFHKTNAVGTNKLEFFHNKTGKMEFSFLGMEQILELREVIIGQHERGYIVDYLIFSNGNFINDLQIKITEKELGAN